LLKKAVFLFGKNINQLFLPTQKKPKEQAPTTAFLPSKKAGEKH
jgi:hypothetical protein